MDCHLFNYFWSCVTAIDSTMSEIMKFITKRVCQHKCFEVNYCEMQRCYIKTNLYVCMYVCFFISQPQQHKSKHKNTKAEKKGSSKKRYTL